MGAIGAGWWATTNHFPLLAASPDVELVALYGPDAGQLAAVGTQFPFQHTTTDADEFFSLGLDAVVIASPHHTHHVHAARALAASLAVLIEKPMTLTAADAWDLERLATDNAAPLLVAYGWNYLPFLEQAAGMLADPGIGEIELVTVRMASPTKDFFSSAATATVPIQWAPQLAGPNPATWQTPGQGGGYAHGQLTHAAGLLFWLTGLRASNVMARSAGPGANVDLYDVALVEFTSGALGCLSGAATLPDDEKFQLDLQLYGSEGVFLIDVERERVELRRHDGIRLSLDVPPGAGSYSCDEPVQRFIQLALGRDVPNNSSANVGARSVELIEALEKSAGSAGVPAHVDLRLVL